MRASKTTDRMQPIDLKEIERELFHVYEWQRGWATHFSSQLFALFMKADLINYNKLRDAFPVEEAALTVWRTCENPEELWERLGFLTRGELEVEK